MGSVRRLLLDPNHEVLICSAAKQTLQDGHIIAGLFCSSSLFL